MIDTIKPRIIFLGTPASAVPVLQLLAAHFNMVAVITEPDAPAGRGRRLTEPPVKVAADKLKIPVRQPATNDDLVTELRRYSADLGVIVAYGKILPAAALAAFPGGLLNLHPSLLPRYRGPAPVAWTLLNGDRATGVSIMKIDAGVDTGPLLSRIKEYVLPDDTVASLTERLLTRGARELIQVVRPYLAGRLQSQPQRGRASHAPKITPEQGKIDWRQPAETIERQIRALNPWPHAFTSWRGQRLIIHQAKLTGGRLIPVTVQLAGRRPVGWADFCRGRHLSPASALTELTGLTAGLTDS